MNKIFRFQYVGTEEELNFGRWGRLTPGMIIDVSSGEYQTVFLDKRFSKLPALSEDEETLNPEITP